MKVHIIRTGNEWPQEIPITEIIQRVAAASIMTGPIALPGAVVGMRVVGVINLSSDPNQIFIDASSIFEPFITVNGQIQQTGSPTGTGIVLITLSST